MKSGKVSRVKDILEQQKTVGNIIGDRPTDMTPLNYDLNPDSEA